jgi:hypothetical protein
MEWAEKVTKFMDLARELSCQAREDNFGDGRRIVIRERTRKGQGEEK